MALSKLDLINSCLRGIGAREVVSEFDTTDDVNSAVAIIDLVNQEFQQRGWWFNREDQVGFELDGGTFEFSATDPLREEVMEITEHFVCRPVKLTLRGQKVYNVTDKTFDLSDLVLADDKIYFNYIYKIPFNDMPEQAKTYLMYKSRRMFSQDIEGDNVSYQQNTRDEDRAYQALETTEFRSRKHNAINQSPTVSTFLANVGGQNARSIQNARRFPRRYSSV